MRIGLFSDTYLPTTNGISYVLMIMQKRLEELGHEVYIFAPATNLRGEEPNDNDHIYRFPAIEGMFFDEQLTSIFFPPRALRKIKALNLDIIHVLTPGPIGLMAAYAALRDNTPLVSQYSTDVYRYIDQYPGTAVPGAIALMLLMPVIFKMTPRETIKLLDNLRPRRKTTPWQKKMVVHTHKVIHDHCEGVIALSHKMQEQLEGWGSTTPVTLLPTGVDPLTEPTKSEIEMFKNEQGISKKDRVLVYVGRLSREKNLDLLLDAFALVKKTHQDVKLLFVGDFDYREELEKRADELGVSEDFICTGRIKREKLGLAYHGASMFLFPSTTDTQGLVVHEAAGAGLPLILCDERVSEVFISNETGLLAKNEPSDMAKQITTLLDDPKLGKQLGARAQKRAAEFSEIGQMQKLEKLYQKWISEHKKVHFAGIDW